jgi:hypothetical protein
MPRTTSFFDAPGLAHPAVPMMAHDARLFLFPHLATNYWVSEQDVRVRVFQKRLINLLDAEVHISCNLNACLPDAYLLHKGENLEEIRKYRLLWPIGMQDEFAELNELAFTAMAEQLLK